MGGVLAVSIAGGLASPASAAEVTLSYDCSANVFNTDLDQGTWTATVSTDLPAQVDPGATVPAPAITAKVTTSEEAAQTLRSLGEKTVEGSSAAAYTVGDSAASAQLTIPVTTIPASGPITTTATGQGQAATAPSTPGTIVVAVGDFTADLTAKDADGKEFGIPVTCTLQPSQDATLATIQVGDAPTSSPTATEPTSSPTATEPTSSPTATEPTSSPTATEPTTTEPVTDPGTVSGPPVQTGVVPDGGSPGVALAAGLITVGSVLGAGALAYRRTRR